VPKATATTRKQSNSRRRPVILATRMAPAEEAQVKELASRRAVSVSELLRAAVLREVAAAR
jgi:hypothetical protein